MVSEGRKDGLTVDSNCWETLASTLLLSYSHSNQHGLTVVKGGGGLVYDDDMLIYYSVTTY